MPRFKLGLISAIVAISAVPALASCGGSEVGRHLLRDNHTYKTMSRWQRECYEVFAEAELDRCKAKCAVQELNCSEECEVSFDSYVRYPTDCATPVMVPDEEGR